MGNVPFAPDVAALETDMAATSFELGLARGQWGVHSQIGTELILCLRSPDGRDFALRCLCNGYPSAPPCIAAWSVERNSIALPEERPLASGQLAIVFRTDWEGGNHLYHPMERCAIQTHPNWRHELPHRVWSTHLGIVQIVEEIYELLHSSDYQSHPMPQP